MDNNTIRILIQELSREKWTLHLNTHTTLSDGYVAMYRVLRGGKCYISDRLSSTSLWNDYVSDNLDTDALIDVIIERIQDVQYTILYIVEWNIPWDIDWDCIIDIKHILHNIQALQAVSCCFTYKKISGYSKSSSIYHFDTCNTHIKVKVCDISSVNRLQTIRAEFIIATALRGG